MKISSEVKTGILVLLGIILFIFGFNYLKGQNLFDDSNTYYTEFDYNALTTSSLVTVKGNSVGKIQDISYDYKTGKTRVAFFVNGELEFSKNSIVRMYEAGLMGGNAIAIIIAEDGETAISGDELKSEVEVGLVASLSKNFSGLSSDLNSTLRSTDSLMVNLNKLVNDDSESGIKSALQELNQTLKSFKNTSNSLHGVIAKNDKNITKILESFTTTSNDLSLLIAQLKDANIGETVASLDGTLNSLNTILATIDKGEGSIGKLLKDDTLYNNLEGATRELESLLKDVKLHPNRYTRILSKKEIPYKEE